MNLNPDPWEHVSLGQCLRAERKYRQRSLREVAKSISVSHSVLARVEAGSSTTIENAVRILRWAEIPIRAWGLVLIDTCKSLEIARKRRTAKP